MAKGSARRKKVVRAMIAFVVVLAVLTFFSNTIMNLTIPKVMGTYATRGNLSYSNSARGTISVDNKTEVKGIDGRVVDQVMVTNYDVVKKGDVILTLKSVEESEDLEAKKDELKQLERDADYESRLPADNTDLSTYYDSINTAKTALAEAKDTLSKVQNKSSVESEDKQIISDETAKSVSLQAAVDAAAKSVEDIKKEIDKIDAEIAPLQSQVDVYVALGTPTPTPKPQPGDPEYTEPDPAYIPDLDEDGIDRNSPTYAMEKLLFKINKFEKDKETYKAQLDAAQARVDEASAELAESQGKIEEAKAEIESLSALPSEQQAQNQVNSAQTALNQAQKALNDAATQAGITADKAQDAMEDREKKMERLKKEIAELEKQAKITSITAPAAGLIYNITVASGDTLAAKDTITSILPETGRKCSVTFEFDAEVAKGISIGMPLEITSGYVEGCTIVSIKPNPDNPRNSRIVKCAIDSDDAWPEEEITVNAGRGNENYKCVVPSSAVSEDNSGTFIYAIVGSSSPLGDKYNVRRIDVNIEATDGAATAITGDGLDKNDLMIVIRSEKPLEDGQRVRLEDYAAK